MKMLRAWTKRLAGLFSKTRSEREFADELESVVALHIEENLRNGMSAEEARRAALLKFGSVEATKEALRDRSTVPLVEHLLKDVRFALRQLHRNPAFTLTAVLVLALGICGSVAIYAFVDAALVKPIPYPNPNNLVAVNENTPRFRLSNLSYLDYADWKKDNQVFSSFEVYKGSGYLLRTAEGTEPVAATRVSAGFFRTLGIAPMLGRDFRTGEDQPGSAKTVMLSYRSWRDRFGGSADVIGKSLTMDGVPYTVIGVLPEHFQFAPRGTPELWTPLNPQDSCESRRSCHNFDGIARLKDGISIEAALASMKAIASRLEQMYPGSNRGQGAIVVPLAEVISGRVRPVLLTLLSGAGLLLLIACVNTASLVLVRSESRTREIAVRISLGASSFRLISQFLVEALVLVFGAAALGLLLAQGGIRLLTGLIPKNMMMNMPYLQELSLNSRVMLFAAAVAGLAVIVLSVAPSLFLLASKAREGLAKGERGSAGNTWRRVGANLVVVELAVAMVLLVGAGLLGRSFKRLLQVELGFQPDHLATIQVILPPNTYKTNELNARTARTIGDTIAALPGVEAVGVTTILPVGFNGNTTWIRIAGKPYNGEHNEANERDVSAGYFQAIGARLVRGRFFDQADNATRPNVVIINRTLARKYFGDEDPLGKQIGDTSLSPKSMTEVVGVVEDIRDGALDAEIWPAVYHPFEQDPSFSFALMVRSTQSEKMLFPAIVSKIRSLDPSIGTRGESTMAGLIDDSPPAYLHRSSAWLVAVFAALALLLGVVGFYGVTAYSVGQRTREIGIRMALGAQRRSVYSLVLREASRLIAVGIVLGVFCSIAAARLAENMLFGVASWDVPTLSVVAVMLALSALLASFVPARRAASLNPVRALNTE